MKDVVVFIVSDNIETQNKATVLYESLPYVNSIDASKQQLDGLGVDYEIKICSAEELPSSIDSNLIFFTDPLIYLPEYFFYNAISLNNLYRDAGVFFGSTQVKYENANKYKLAIKRNYHTYNVDFGGSVLCDVTDEDNNYASLIGSVVTGSAYNRVGYSPCRSPRGTFADNKAFVKQISQTHRIYYCRDLIKIKSLPESVCDHKTISDYFYQMGYQDGLVLALKNNASKTQEIWNRFVESPELLDHEMPRWLFDEPQKDNSEYLELLVVLKCKYNIGLFEAMLGKKLI